MDKRRRGKSFIKQRIKEVLSSKKSEKDFMSDKTLEELLEEVSIYHQELEYQNEEFMVTQEKLTESQQHYFDLFDKAPVSYVVFDEKNTIINCNISFSKLIGTSKGEIKGKKINEFIAPENQNDFYFHSRKLFAEKGSESFHFDILANGIITSVIFESNYYFYNGDALVRCAITDISNEKKLQFDLTERIKELNGLLQVSNLGNRNGIKIDDYLNQVIDIIPSSFQYPECVGVRVLFYDQEFKSECYSSENVTISESINKENENIGSITISCYNSINSEEVFLEEEKKFLGAVANLISQFIESKEKAEIIKQREQYYRTILHGLHENILVIDKELIITDINSNFNKVIGYERNDIIGKKCFEVPLGLNEVCNKTGKPCELLKVFETGKPSVCMHKQALPNQEVAYFDIILSPILDDKGNVTHVIEAARDVTDMVKSQKLIEESERRYRLLITQMQQGLALHEVVKDECGKVVDYRFLEVNDGFEKLTGLSREKIIGKTVLEILPNTEKYWIDKFGGVAITTQPESFESYSSELDRYYQVHAFAPKVDQFAVIVSDITEKKEIEKILKLNEERYRNLFENSHAVMLVIDPQNAQIVDANSAAESFYGWTRYELRQMNIAQINTLSESDIKAEMALAATEKRRYFVFKHKLKNGKVRDVEVFSGPIGIGDRTYLYSFVHDITEKLRAEENLKISEARFRKLAETSKTIFWEFDPIENLWLYVSPQVNFILGYEPSEWKNFEFWADRIHNDDKETTIGICNAATARGEDHEMEYRFLKPNGDIVWLREEVNVEVVNGKPFRMRGTMMDITSRKVAEIALKKSESNLKEAQKIALLGRWEHNIATDELYWSDMVFEIFGKDTETYKPDLNSFLSYIHPDEKDVVHQSYFKALKDKSAYKIEHRLLMPDGRVKWVAEEANFFYNQKGEPQRSVGIVQDITQRKLIELALKASEQKFQALFNNLTVGVSLISPNMELLQVNPKIKEWFPKGDYNDKPFCYCTFSTPTQDQPCDDCPVKKTFIDGKIYEAERQVETPRGMMYFRVVSTPIFNDEGQVEATVEMMDNITARKIAEIALKESEHKHRTLFETMEQGVVYQDANGFIFSANKAAQRILGLSLKQMQGRESTDVRWRAVREDETDYPGEEHPSMVALRTGKLVKNAIMGIFHPTENEYKWILVNAVPEFESDNKNPYRVYVTFTDITQRKKHEKVLKEQKDFLETLMQTIPNPIFYKDKDGKYIGCNKAFEDYVGLSEKNIVGKTVFDISSKRHAPVYKKWDTTLLKTLKNQHYEWIVERSNGQIRDVIFDKAPIFNAKGEVSGIIGVITDISDRKKAEQEVKSNTERLKALVRIFEHKANSVKPLLDYALTEALNLTSSSIGYIYLYDEQKEQFILNSWSRNVMEQCSIANPQTCYELSKTGIWGEVVRQRKEIVVNNFQAKHPLKKGYPEGHTQINRYMSIPVIIDEKIVAVVGVGNKTEEYNETDLNQLKLLMGSVWGIVQRREDSEKISKLSIAVEQSSASIVITDINGNIEYVNPKFTEITGYSFDEAIGENPRVLNAGFHDKTFFKELWGTIVKGKDWKGQLVNRKKTGELYWESASVSPVRNSEGKIINFIAIKDDITELKRAEEALQDSELKLRRMIEQSPDGIMLTDENGRVVAWNKALESISRIPASKVVGIDLIEFHKLLPTKNKSKIRDKEFQRLIVDLISVGKTVKFPLNKIHEVSLYVDNEERFIQLMVFVIPSERGNMLASFARDITMQKKAEFEIKEREEKLQAIFDNSIQSFVILSKDLIVQAYNYVAWERAKYFFEKEFAVGKSIYDVYPNSIVHEVMREANKVLDGEATRYEMPMKDQSDNTFWFELHFSPVFDENKNVVSIFFNSIDITQRKLAEESMARSLEKEKELGELKSRFVSTVSHEFRTPLASIFSNTQLLHRYHTKWEEEKKNLSFKRIYESVKLMTGMLENVSLIGKEQSGRFTFRPEVINLKQFVIQIVEESHLTLNESYRVELVIEGEFERVLLDQILLRHILINILSNAIKYSKGGPSVIFIVRIVKRFIEFNVQDFGVGIPKKELDKIYDPFFRASNSENYSGTGLGMAIVKQCVDTHSGTISVESVINKGTTVKVLLPLRVL